VYGGAFLSHWANRETRRENRYPTSDEATVSVGPPYHESLPCKVLNVSRSGMQLELNTKMAMRDRVQITLASDVSRGVVIFGEIRYCQRAGDLFRAGVEIHDAVFGRTLVSDHIDEDRLSLYAAGQGLTSSEVLRIKRHLERCAVCIAALNDTVEVRRRVQEQQPPTDS
jgi:hypothetical protein